MNWSKLIVVGSDRIDPPLSRIVLPARDRSSLFDQWRWNEFTLCFDCSVPVGSVIHFSLFLSELCFVNSYHSSFYPHRQMIFSYLFRHSLNRTVGRTSVNVILDSQERVSTRTYVRCGPCGLMVKASDFESGDCRFESCQGRPLLFFHLFPSHSNQWPLSKKFFLFFFREISDVWETCRRLGFFTS